MEQIQNQDTNTIVIDDGSKEYDIKNHYGENLAVFRFLRQTPTSFPDMRKCSSILQTLPQMKKNL